MAPVTLFTQIINREIPAEIVYEDDGTIVFMDINPATRGHMLVVPKTPAKDLYEISPEDLAECTRVAKLMAERARDKLGADGVNLLNSCGVAAWQSVFHFHIHVIPRYVGDPLKLPWVPEAVDDGELSAVAANLRAS